MHAPYLEALQLRLGIDSTPLPYFRPSLKFQPPINVRTLNLIQIDDEPVLRSVGAALRIATHLKELTMWADGDSMLSLSEVSSSWHGCLPFELTFLDLRGFVDLGTRPCALWNLFSPVKLMALTLHVGPEFDVADCSEFWETSVVAELRPKQLSTNLVVHGLKQFIHSFSGLEAFSITSPNVACRPEPLPLLLDALEEQHSTTLKVLSVDPQGALANHLLDDETLMQMPTRFTNIEEFRFGMLHTLPVKIVPWFLLTDALLTIIF